MIGPGRREKLRKPRNRLLLAMSVYDMLYSLVKAWTFLLAPKGYGVPGAQGNMATCRLQAFFIEFTHATGAYNSLLSIYYWLSICKGVKPGTFSKYEPYAHGMIFITFLSFAVCGLVIELYNPVFGFCFIGSYPPACETSSEAPPCDRFPPESLGLLYEIFAQMWVQAYIVIVIITNTLIWMKVREQDRVIKRYSFAATTQWDSRQSFSLRRRQSDLGRSKSVALQSTLYVAAFIACWIGPTLFHLIGWIWGIQSFWAVFVIVLFTPLQGFWNAFIYARPTYLRMRQKFPHMGRYQTAKSIFFDADPLKLAFYSLRQPREVDNLPNPRDPELIGEKIFHNDCSDDFIIDEHYDNGIDGDPMNLSNDPYTKIESEKAAGTETKNESDISTTS